MKHSEKTVEVRVTGVARGQCMLAFADGERAGEVTGSFRHAAKSPADFPVIGDWVTAVITAVDRATIHSILPRKTVLSRKVPGKVVEEQVMAANVDVAFIVTSFNDDFNVRRLERFAAMAEQANIASVVLLNKSDLADANDTRFSEATAVLPPGTVHRVCALKREGIEAIQFYLSEGKTGIFVGSSGVGKSSLLNCLLGSSLQPTQEIRESDGKGRHTTTSRQMFSLTNGGFIIDTPGIRELQLWADEDVLPEVFTDISEFINTCRFSNCRHEGEPSCAIQAALSGGTLDEHRWQSYLKLQKEVSRLQRKKKST